MTSPLVFERLSAGITREMMAAAAELDVERLRRAEDGQEPLTEAEDLARKAGLRRLIDQALARRTPAEPADVCNGPTGQEKPLPDA